MMAMRDIREWGPVPWRDTGLVYGKPFGAPEGYPSALADLASRVMDAAERRGVAEGPLHDLPGLRPLPAAGLDAPDVVFGAGNADADLMFVGEAPGKNEDRAGPAVRRPGREAARPAARGDRAARDDVFIANVLKCRPPGNRDPQPVEIDNCQGYLFDQVALIQPKVICTLGNFATKLLRDDQTGITRIHGRDEIRVIGTRAVRLLPLHHPAAALYTRSILDLLREDFARIPELLARPAARPARGGAAAARARAGARHPRAGAGGRAARARARGRRCRRAARPVLGAPQTTSSSAAATIGSNWRPASRVDAAARLSAAERAGGSCASVTIASYASAQLTMRASIGICSPASPSG